VPSATEVERGMQVTKWSVAGSVRAGVRSVLRPLAAVWLGWVIGSACVAASPGPVAQGNVCGDTQVQAARQKSLRRIAAGVLKAIADGDVQAFIGFVSQRGMAFGVDKPPVPKEELVRELGSHSGVYCLLFSTACMSTDPGRGVWESDPFLSRFHRSYREWLSTHRSYTMNVELLTDSALCGGLVMLNPRSAVRIELQFVYEGATWKLVNTPYSLGD
jgi:hypothetical protein